MIRNTQMLQEFEDKLVSQTPQNVQQNFKLADALLNEAIQLGIIPVADPLAGLEEKINMIRIINALR